MDVKCQQCGVEYEFDDERITAEGVTVKCTSCAHIFKVKREVRVITETVPVEAPLAASSDWMVRQASGNVFNFKELTTLQRWIVERKVHRDDEISRTGKTWKRLGDIAELASFFQVVDDATQRSVTEMQHIALTQTPQAPSMFGLEPMPGPAAASPRSTQPMGTMAPVASPAPAQARPIPLVAAATPAAALLAQPAPPVPVAAAGAAPGPTPALPQPTDAAPIVTSHASPSVVRAAEASWEDSDDFLDDDDPVRAWKQRRRWPKALMFLVLLTLGAGIGLRLFARPTFDVLIAELSGLMQPTLPPVVEKAVEQARLAAQHDTLAGLQAAITAATDAIKIAPESAQPFAALALVETALAEARRQQLDAAKRDYDKLIQVSPEGFADNSPDKARAQKLAAQAEQFSNESNSHFRRAADAVKEALQLEPKSALVRLAAADYSRALLQQAQMVQHLAALPADVQKGDVLARMIETLAKLNKAPVSDEAIDALAALIAEHPTLGRARFRLVLALDALGRREQATKAATALVEALPQHERARAWLQQAQAKEPVKKIDPPPRAPKAGSKKPLSFDALMTRADRLRDRGDTDKAMTYYIKAAGLEPTRAEPRAGMGWCYLDKGKTSAAISSFQSALDANSSFADAHMGLAESYRSLGKKDRALKHYKRYLDILPSGGEASVARRWVAELSDGDKP